MKTISPLDKTHTAVPLVKYQQLFDVAAQAAELLKSQPRDNAKEALASLTAYSARLTDEQKALARAQTALRDARNAAKRTRALAAKLVPTAITLGELLEIASIASFTTGAVSSYL